MQSNYKHIARYTALGVGAMHALLLHLSGFQFDSTFKAIVGFLPLATVLALTVWDFWIWRLPLVRGVTCRPRIDGLWRAVLKPTGESHIPEGGNRGPINTYLLVSQSYWSMHVRQVTPESRSDSRSFFWDRKGAAQVDSLTFIYGNEPRHEHQHRSMRHLGSCTLVAGSVTPTRLSGSYFTDRYTKGDMDITFISRSRNFSTFAEIEEHLSRKPASP